MRKKISLGISTGYLRYPHYINPNVVTLIAAKPPVATESADEMMKDLLKAREDCINRVTLAEALKLSETNKKWQRTR